MKSFNLYLTGFWFNEYTGHEADLMDDALVFFGEWGDRIPDWITPEMITYQPTTL